MTARRLPALAFLALLLIASAAPAAEKDTKVYELRSYTAEPGKLDALHARFRDHTMKLFEKHGMTNVGYWVPVNNKGNVLIYLLSFPSKEAREKSWKDFLADPEWVKAKAESEKDGVIVAKVDSRFMTPTEYSSIK